MKIKKVTSTIAPIPFTKDGYEKIKKEYEDLLKERPTSVSELKRAREMGDLSENGFYKGARAKLSQVDSRLHHLKMLLKYVIIKESSQTQIVVLGCKVTVNEGKEERTFSIVGHHEANPSENKISHVSPIGKMLLNRKVGGVVEIEIPAGKITYKIHKISS